MKSHEKAALLKRYSDRLAQMGPTRHALGWNKPKHNLRYRVLLEYWLAEPTAQPLRVLDFGCGFGDLLGYARDRGIIVEYTGLDINEDLIRAARARYPETRFVCRDLFEATLDERFDVVLASGVHNFRLSNNREFIQRCFDVFDSLADVGFAANFLSDRVNFQNADNFYSAPEDILSLAMRYSPRVMLRHDYMPFEFTVFVDKRSEIDEQLTVFLPFIEDCTE
jgi:SAM-dependent methyltransferase